MEEKWKHINGQFGLQAFMRSSWFTDKSKSSFWIRTYTSLGEKHAEFTIRMRELFGNVDWGKNILVAFGQMEGLKVPAADSVVYANEEGVTTITYMIREITLPKANYIWISTPYCVDGKQLDVSDTISFLDRISALLCVHFGRNFLHEIVFDGEVKADTGGYGTKGYDTKSIVQRTPTASDGPFLVKQLSDDMVQVMQRLRVIPQEVRTRVELALCYCEKAQRQNEGFLEYWTSMEILCGGKAQKIRYCLQKCYAFQSRNEVDSKLGFGVVAKWRHDMIHKGLKPVVSANVERYLQLMFLDLLRYELGIDTKRYMVIMQRAREYNLSSLGLA
jgi:hypothetical protein